jgi:hypothetical protein
VEKKAVWSEMEAFGQFKGRKGRGSSLVLKNGNRRPKAEIAGVEGRDLVLGASTGALEAVTWRLKMPTLFS